MFSTVVFEKFYTNEKYKELESYAQDINEYFRTNDISDRSFRTRLIDGFQKPEKNNIEIIWFIYDESSSHADIGYSTKITGRYNINDGPDIEKVKEYVGLLITGGKIDSLIDLYSYTTDEINDYEYPSINLITLVYQVSDTQSSDVLKSYIVLSSAKESISTIAQNTQRFVMLVSLSTFLLAVIAVIIISTRITKPIVDIKNVANKIATLDFSQTCTIKTKDELGDLGKSINEMSSKLQDSIGYLEQRTQMLKTDLEKQELNIESKKDFMAAVSHDFKTPLSLILAYSELLDDKYTHDAETRKQLAIISEQVVRMNMMVNQLLTLSQLESNTATLDDSVFCINEAIESVIEDFKIIIEHAGIKLTFTFKDDYIVRGDFDKITQVLTNLIENAVKYCDERKIININVTSMNNKIRIAVYNTHKGISDESLSKLFNSFYKEDTSRQGSPRSYGLGLSIVKAIVEMHKGTYGAYNANAGVVFWFELDELIE